MNTDTSPASYPDIPDDALVIFIGHSDDANEEAQAVLSLESKLERTFREYLALSGGDCGFQSLWLWEWNKDASSRPGGQQTVVAPVLSQAKIGLFVLKERIGAVTWDELETMRERSKTEHLQLLAFFPEEPPKSLKLGTSKKDASQWLEVLTKRDELSGNWVNPGAASVTPLEQYRDCEHLKTIAFERLSKAIHAVLCEQSKPLKRRKYSHFS
ncbi:MAG: signal transduction protein, partial [Chlorobiaceae bacterium]|nr:signal transduction protein [Chlorobiaceae bacterium]